MDLAFSALFNFKRARPQTLPQVYDECIMILLSFGFAKLPPMRAGRLPRATDSIKTLEKLDNENY
jgi:hypothetical protein